MTDDREPAIQFTDEEAAFLRHVRFGELPPRILPTEMVETVETDARRDIPDPLPDMYAWGIRISAA